MTNESKLLVVSANAVALINSLYDWLTMVEEAGGTGSISGVAKANAMFTSMNKNREKINTLIIDPLLVEIELAKDSVKET